MIQTYHFNLTLYSPTPLISDANLLVQVSHQSFHYIFRFDKLTTLIPTIMTMTSKCLNKSELHY